MSRWHCPHCGTPQAESSRCWVCKRSSTSCGTCRHFRRAIAAQLGYCGLDRRRLPLRGDEMRGCWESARERLEPPTEVRPAPPSTGWLDGPRLDFVSLEPGAPLPAEAAVAPVAAAPPAPRARPVDPLLGFWAEEG